MREQTAGKSCSVTGGGSSQLAATDAPIAACDLQALA